MYEIEQQNELPVAVMRSDLVAYESTVLPPFNLDAK